MKSLADHEAECQLVYDHLGNEPVLNGIACPRCGEELWDTCPNLTITSNPPKKAIHCTCGYRGYRTA